MARKMILQNLSIYHAFNNKVCKSNKFKHFLHHTFDSSIFDFVSEIIILNLFIRIIADIIFIRHEIYIVIFLLFKLISHDINLREPEQKILFILFINILS